MEERRRDGYVLSGAAEMVDVDRVHQWLAKESYWAKNRPRDVIAQSITNSVPYSILAGGDQVAFARVVTDDTTFGSICDVFVDTAHRGRGLGTWLIDTIVEDMTDRGILRLLLATKDAHEVYRRSGFTELEGPGRFMEIDRRPTRAAILGHA